jgi:hypothetical protein
MGQTVKKPTINFADEALAAAQTAGTLQEGGLAAYETLRREAIDGDPEGALRNSIPSIGPGNLKSESDRLASRLEELSRQQFANFMGAPQQPANDRISRFGNGVIRGAPAGAIDILDIPAGARRVGRAPAPIQQPARLEAYGRPNLKPNFENTGPIFRLAALARFRLEEVPQALNENDKTLQGVQPVAPGAQAAYVKKVSPPGTIPMPSPYPSPTSSS